VSQYPKRFLLIKYKHDYYISGITVHVPVIFCPLIFFGLRQRPTNKNSSRELAKGEFEKRFIDFTP
jgi:hypothetical protein